MSFIVLPKLIPPPYFLTFMAHFYSSTNAIVVGVRVGIRVKIKIKVKVKVKVKSEVEGCIYILYSC